jgi:hypothetical protein
MGDGGRYGKPLHAKEIGSGVLSLHNVAMTAAEFEERIIAWARRRPDIEALIQFGSRVQNSGVADALSDWDFHLYTTQPRQYCETKWLEEIGSVWCANAERTLRGVTKISAFFEGGYEVDFIPLAVWQMKLVFNCMLYPRWAAWMPSRLHNGILETREIFLNSGTRVLIGGEKWERLLEALHVTWPNRRMSVEELQGHVEALWQKSVWVTKKIVRPEPRSAVHWMHKMIVQHLYALLEEEAWLAGKKARPEALKAEQWLDARRLAQTDITTSLDQKVLARALLAQIGLFEEVSRSVATARGFRLRDYSGVAGWLRAELGKVLAGP